MTVRSTVSSYYNQSSSISYNGFSSVHNLFSVLKLADILDFTGQVTKLWALKGEPCEPAHQNLTMARLRAVSLSLCSGRLEVVGERENGCRFFLVPTTSKRLLRRLSLSFSCSPLSKTRDTQMATRETDGARWERHEKKYPMIRSTLNL